MPDDPILQFFQYNHLPESLRSISRPFGALANNLVVTLPRNAERTVALRKLLEAKDAAVRASMGTDEKPACRHRNIIVRPGGAECMDCSTPAREVPLTGADGIGYTFEAEP